MPVPPTVVNMVGGVFVPAAIAIPVTVRMDSAGTTVRKARVRCSILHVLLTTLNPPIQKLKY